MNSVSADMLPTCLTYQQVSKLFLPLSIQQNLVFAVNYGTTLADSACTDQKTEKCVDSSLTQFTLSFPMHKVTILPHNHRMPLPASYFIVLTLCNQLTTHMVGSDKQ
jgi:hypothetical protein